MADSIGENIQTGHAQDQLSQNREEDIAGGRENARHRSADSNWEYIPDSHPQQPPISDAFGPSYPLTSPEIALLKPYAPHWANKKDRLATYDTWSPSMCFSKETMASKGWAYTGFGDRVICWACGVVLFMFDPSDDVDEEHRKYSPMCPLAQFQTSISKTFANLHPVRITKTKEGQTKEELIEKVELLEEKLKCKVCYESICDIILTNCGHLVCCQECVLQLQKCPVCREPIHRVSKVFW